jgi:hypothetical protein
MYLASNMPFRGIEARDDRLPSREPVYAFQLGGTRYAVPFSALEGGAVFRAGGRELFFYRPRDSELHQSTLAFEGAGDTFVEEAGGWTHLPSRNRFHPDRGGFAGGREPGPIRLEGLDTFWYMWSLTHPETEVLEPVSR